MATVQLYNHECLEGGLPAVCVCCGARAEHFKGRQFSWAPSWLCVVEYVGMPGFLSDLLKIRRRVVLPFCTEHRTYYKQSPSLVVGLFLGTIALIIALFVIANQFDPGLKNLGLILCLVSVGLFFGMLFGIIVAQLKKIGASEITDRTITLYGVDDFFVTALFRDRIERKRDERDRRDRHDEDDPPRRTYRDDV